VRTEVTCVVEKYLDAVRRNDPTGLPIHPEVTGVFPMNTYRGAAAFLQALEPFAKIVKHIEVVRLVVDGEHCVALLNIDTTFGTIPFAEHIHVVGGQIVSVRGYYDPRPMLGAASANP
jgi:hypothetical protein